MSVAVTEQHQIEQLKQWWKNHGTMSIVILLVAIVAGLGWHFWQKHREDKLERASAHYEELLNAAVNDDDANALKEANLLRNNYTHTPYAALATLLIARSDVYQERYADAINQLNWVIKHANSDSLKEVARLRLARVLLQENKPADALVTLKKVNDKAYLPMIQELVGDSYLMQGKVDDARAAYQKGLDVLPAYALMRPLLVMKLNNLTPIGNS